MSLLMRLRVAVARRLPQPVKRALRRVLPAWLVAWRPTIRAFALTMPLPPRDLGPAVREAAAPARVRIEAPFRSYVPRLLEDGGVARYEPETMAAFLAAISFGEATEVFDVGANVGVFSIVAAATTRAAVTGFEPTPQLAATYRSIVAANSMNCTMEEIALGDRSGRATLYISARTDSSNSLAAGFRPAAGSVDVPVERLDDYLARTGRRPSIMKMDTESTEPDVLAGAPHMLETLRPWIICEVLWSKTETRLEKLLRPAGYRFHHIGETGPVARESIAGDDTYRHRDWLFTPGPMPADFGRHFRAWRQAIEETA